MLGLILLGLIHIAGFYSLGVLALRVPAVQGFELAWSSALRELAILVSRGGFPGHGDLYRWGSARLVILLIVSSASPGWMAMLGSGLGVDLALVVRLFWSSGFAILVSSASC